MTAIHSATELKQQRYTSPESLALLIQTFINNTDEATIFVSNKNQVLLSGENKCITIKARPEGVIEVYEVTGYYNAPIFLMALDLDEALFNAEKINIEIETGHFQLSVIYDQQSTTTITVDDLDYTGGGCGSGV